MLFTYSKYTCINNVKHLNKFVFIFVKQHYNYFYNTLFSVKKKYVIFFKK